MNKGKKKWGGGTQNKANDLIIKRMPGGKKKESD